MDFTGSIANIESNLLTTDNEQDRLHAAFMLARANWLGDRKARAFYLLGDVADDERHAVADRLQARLLLARLLTTISADKAVDEHVAGARQLIDGHRSQLGSDCSYFELLCRLEEWRKLQKFRFDYKCNKALNSIVDESLRILEMRYDERYYQLIWDILYILSQCQTGINSVQRILSMLKTSHYWRLFQCYTEGNSAIILSPILGDFNNQTDNSRILKNNILLYYILFIIKIN